MKDIAALNFVGAFRLVVSVVCTLSLVTSLTGDRRTASVTDDAVYAKMLSFFARDGSSLVMTSHPATVADREWDVAAPAPSSSETPPGAIVDPYQTEAINPRRLPAATPPDWAAFGIDGGGYEGIVSVDGTVASRVNGPAVRLGLLSRPSGHFIRPTVQTVRQFLVEGNLPIITTVWTTPDWVVQWSTFAESSGANPIARGPDDTLNATVLVQVHPRSQNVAATLYVVVDGTNPTGVFPMHDVEVTPTNVTTAGLTVLVADRSADHLGTLDARPLETNDVSGVNPASSAVRASSELGLAQAFLGYDISAATEPNPSLAFTLPMATGSLDVSKLGQRNAEVEQQRVATAWRGALNQVNVTLPDQELQNSFYASLAYLLMARGQTGVASGPTSERATWVRDSAYITMALSSTGHSDASRSILDAIDRSQLASGRLPPMLNPDGTVRMPMKTEWDSQGQYIYAVVEYARLTHDDAFLRSVYPHIRLAAQYQRDLLQATRTTVAPGSPLYGLLPAGESAEDLYDPTWHHYWDDFWALTGFQEGAEVAQQLGQLDDASWMKAEEDRLRGDLLASVVASKTYAGDPYIGNGPEDMTSTAMARSATPSVWPLEVLDPRSPLVQHSFLAYYTWLIEKNGGAYQHYGNNDWPYAGVSLAHAFYRVGLVDQAWQIIRWSLQHQTVPGLYAWGEAVDPKKFDVVSGDTPHSWMAAELILFVREVLVHEDGQRLDIGPFAITWLNPNARVEVHHLPTTLGDMGYTMQMSADGNSLTITFDQAGPKDGYRLVLPAIFQVKTATVDNKTRTVSSSTIDLPAGTHTAVLQLRRPG